MKAEDIKRQLGLRIKALREGKRWRQDDVQEEFGFSSRYLGRIERGAVNLTLDTLIRLCEIFEVGLPDLFNFMDAGEEAPPEREGVILRLNSILSNNDPEEIRKLGVFLEEIL